MLPINRQASLGVVLLLLKHTVAATQAQHLLLCRCLSLAYSTAQHYTARRRVAQPSRAIHLKAQLSSVKHSTAGCTTSGLMCSSCAAGLEAKHTLSIGLVHHVQPLPKHRMQMTVHVNLYAMLTQLAIDGELASSVDLAPQGHLRVQDGAEWVVTICQKNRAAAICPETQASKLHQP